ncbi:ACT domain-containing protein [Kalaharituber pfeilii]|nr:ACT domain-containing protein [Kalaharituber pfeilii]
MSASIQLLVKLPWTAASRTSSWAQTSAIAGNSPPSSVTWSRSSSCSGFSEPLLESSVSDFGGLRTTARILQDCNLSLIHIPLHLYPHFIQPILSLLLPLSGQKSRTAPDSFASYDEPRLVRLTSSDDGDGIHEFANISVTPVECSVVCPKVAVDRLFRPIIDRLNTSAEGDVVVTEDDFVVLQVDGDGLDAGKRVLDLTSPLAFAGISIFFITTYFSDYILVPAKNRVHVTKVLEEQGFAFEKHSDAFVVTHHRTASSASSTSVPSTPLPTTIEELEAKTFTTLKRQNVVPTVNIKIKLVLCAGRRSVSRSGAAKDDSTIYLGLVKCLLNKPEFLSVTLTNHEPASLLLQQDMLTQFGSSDVLLGSKGDVLIPIVLDLRGLPVESTGIVCGVAGRLVGRTGSAFLGDDSDSVEMSYLSTARAGTVMVAEEDIERAIAALSMGA